MRDFIDYVLSFYGNNGLYDMKATSEEAWNALAIYLNSLKYSFEGDSLDRERVRDIILEQRQEGN